MSDLTKEFNKPRKSTLQRIKEDGKRFALLGAAMLASNLIAIGAVATYDVFEKGPQETLVAKIVATNGRALTSENGTASPEYKEFEKRGAAASLAAFVGIGVGAAVALRKKQREA